MPIYRGVDGVNRLIEDQYRGVEGINRKILKQFRGVEGVNRLVFNKGVVLSSIIFNTQYLDGIYESQNYGNYLWSRIYGRHVNGNTDSDRVHCGWDVLGVSPGDNVGFTYQFETNPTGVMWFDLFKNDGAGPSTIVSYNTSSGTTTVVVSENRNRARLAINCGSSEVADKRLKITKITLNGAQIYP